MPWLVIHMMREIRLGGGGGVKEGRAENKKLNENHIREARHKNATAGSFFLRAVVVCGHVSVSEMCFQAPDGPACKGLMS